MNHAQKIYHEQLTTFDHLTFALPNPIYWTATILLFSLRKLAVPLSAIAIGVDLAVLTRLALTSNWLAALGSGIAVVASGLIIELAIFLYALRLARIGILN